MSSYLVWDGSGGYLGHYGEKLKNEIEADKHAVGYTIVPRHHAKLATRMLEALEIASDLASAKYRTAAHKTLALGQIAAVAAEALSEARAHGGSDA